MQGVVLSNNERDFIASALSQGLRVDGRTNLEMRNVKINFGESRGEVEVQLGTSRASCCVTADIVPPFPDRPTEG